MREFETRNFWLQMTNDFYDSDRMLYLESQPHGQEYSHFYTKLLLKSVRTNGVLRLSEKIAYNEAMLANCTRMPVELVKPAMAQLIALDLVRIWDDGTIFLPELEDMVGSETIWAGRKRKSREKKQDEEANVPDKNENEEDNVPINKRKEKNNKENHSKEKERTEEAPAGGSSHSLSEERKSKYGSYGWVELTDSEHAQLCSELGEAELARCIAYIDESAQSNGNRNHWRDWALILRRCSRNGWGTAKQQPQEPPAEGEWDKKAELERMKSYLTKLKGTE